ncbi:MAG: hypothetical protein H6736_17680 [Alphaproteobacteria bacterium]|nr:hypothetical protein [Alphaproteobacteria bacterium]
MVVVLHAALAFTGDELAARAEEVAAHRAKSGLGDVTPGVPHALYRKAADGGVHTDLVAVPGHKAKQALGVAVLDVPIERFWSAVNDDVSKPSYTKLSYTEILEGELCGDRRLVFMYLPISMLSDRYWVVEARKNRALMDATGGAMREMTWDSRPAAIPPDRKAATYAAGGMEIGFAKGAWWLTSLGPGHTLVEYWTWTDPGGYVPAGLASSMAAGGIEDTIRQMGRLATEGGRCALQ